MISQRLKYIFLLTILLTFVHGGEEIATGFYQKDLFILFFAKYFSTIPQTFFFTFHFMWWIVLLVTMVFLIGGRFAYWLLTLVSVIYVFELHHVVKALLASGYYPGVITALFFPILGFFFWKELIRNWR